VVSGAGVVAGAGRALALGVLRTPGFSARLPAAGLRKPWTEAKQALRSVGSGGAGYRPVPLFTSFLSEEIRLLMLNGVVTFRPAGPLPGKERPPLPISLDRLARCRYDSHLCGMGSL
jgi:hypothetical protein